MRLIIIVFVFIYAEVCYAQTLTSPDFVATYDFRCIKDTTTGEYFGDNEFILIKGDNTSRFHHAHAQFNDSILVLHHFMWVIKSSPPRWK